MNKIKQLPKQISDKIAAGEVVTGPISVVKELVENSIDADAGSLTIEIKNGGKKYIRVTDNGTGISVDDVELAFSPHATSKITYEDDLDSINTLGFRGEALTSIATVSKLEMITKTADEKVGVALYIEGGKIIEKKETGANTGTTVIVRDLYYNTPARLKFMKSDRAESTKIIDLVSKIAIAYPNIKIRLINNDNILFSTNGKGDLLNNIQQIYGSDKSAELMEISESGAGDYQIYGYISASNHTYRSRKQQIYFINGRSINSKIIEKSISKGYSEFVFKDRYPVVYLFIKCEPAKLDVNVHPSKTEVRFREEDVLSNLVYESIYNRLKKVDAIPNISDSKLNKNKEQIYKSTSDENIKNTNQNDSDVKQVNIKTLMSSYREEDDYENISSVVMEDNKDIGIIGKGDSGTYVAENKSAKKYNDGYVNIAELNILGSIFSTYILAVDDDIFYIMDQHAAHERINYERFLKQYQSDEKLSQQLLEPLIINVSGTFMNEIESWTELINRLGYEVEVFGENSIVAKAVPAFISFTEAEDMLNDLIGSSNEELPKNNVSIEKLIQRACKVSVKANRKLSLTEIQALLSDLEKCDNPYACPHGRPVFIKLSKHDVEKLFRRV